MSISTPAWTSTSFFPPPNSSRLWPPVRKKGTLSGNPIKGVREFSAKPERSRTELRAVSYREADVRGRESPDSGIPYIGRSYDILEYTHIKAGRESKRESDERKRRVAAEKRAKRFRLKEEDDYLWDGCIVARPCHA
ncbi:PREDICTED: uncharacterized protein LOC108756912 isoform X2 [Trachymyrmex septentrionalis]|uniref:uncharacterized protein LOC108756912 isoform X2 n=1 Tax=Trachymyrmex septentrionalis TaxID=34720 RepID=UPI00084F66AE|nr:PREDICTED: uncharacterized protein LOC108756912 isoform X2 [Trachymyrmex septentrionalis]